MPVAVCRCLGSDSLAVVDMDVLVRGRGLKSTAGSDRGEQCGG